MTIALYKLKYIPSLERYFRALKLSVRAATVFECWCNTKTEYISRPSVDMMIYTLYVHGKTIATYKLTVKFWCQGEMEYIGKNTIQPMFERHLCKWIHRIQTTSLGWEKWAFVSLSRFYWWKQSKKFLSELFSELSSSSNTFLHRFKSCI